MTTHEVEEMLDVTKKMLIYYENEGLVKLQEIKIIIDVLENRKDLIKNNILT